MICSVISSKFFNFNFELTLLERIGSVTLPCNDCIKESASSSVDFGADTSQITFDNAIEAILFYLGWIVVILPSARSASNHLSLTPCLCLCSIDPHVKLAVVKF